MTDLPPFAWALIGPGRIAHRFAEAVSGLSGACLRSVHGRDGARATAFAQRWAMPGRAPPRVEKDLATLLADPAVQAVYIATPHSGHADLVRRCLEAGKPVLCEKPLAPTLAQAEALVALARERGVFLMEGLWTCLLPVYGGVRRWLEAGEIGAVRSLQSSFCFSVPFDPRSRLFDPALAGGALLDIGIYNLAMTRWVLATQPGQGLEPLAMHADGVLSPTGVDQRVSAMLTFPGGVVSQFVCAFDGCADNGLRIAGERGSITLPDRFWEATDAMLTRPGRPAETLACPFRINGFEEEIEEVMRCVRTGRSESAHVPHAETLAWLGWIDRLRGQLGVRYPFE